MHVDYTPQQKALRAEIRAYFSKLITPGAALGPVSRRAGGRLAG